MADLDIPNQFSPRDKISADKFNQNYGAVEDYVNDRNAGDAAWDAVRSTSISDAVVPLVANATGGQNVAQFVGDYKASPDVWGRSSNVFSIGSTGIISKGSMNYIHRHRTVDEFAALALGSPRKIIFDGGDLNYVTEEGKFTCPVSGIWRIGSSVKIENVNYTNFNNYRIADSGSDRGFETGAGWVFFDEATAHGVKGERVNSEVDTGTWCAKATSSSTAHGTPNQQFGTHVVAIWKSDLSEVYYQHEMTLTGSYQTFSFDASASLNENVIVQVLAWGYTAGGSHFRYPIFRSGTFKSPGGTINLRAKSIATTSAHYDNFYFSNTLPTSYKIFIYKNGAAVAQKNFPMAITTDLISWYPDLSATIEENMLLNAGDYIEIYISCDNFNFWPSYGSEAVYFSATKLA